MEKFCQNVKTHPDYPPKSNLVLVIKKITIFLSLVQDNQGTMSFIFSLCCFTFINFYLIVFCLSLLHCYIQGLVEANFVFVAFPGSLDQENSQQRCCLEFNIIAELYFSCILQRVYVLLYFVLLQQNSRGCTACKAKKSIKLTVWEVQDHCSASAKLC